jgi:hypothetical protein
VPPGLLGGEPDARMVYRDYAELAFAWDITVCGG